MSGKGAGAFLGGVLLGTAIGSILGILLAPNSGKETRKLLRQQLKEIPNLAEDASQNPRAEIEKLVESARKSLDETIEKLNESIEANRSNHTSLEKNIEVTAAAPPASEV